MKPTEDYRNGDVGSGGSTASRSDDSEGEEATALEQELSLEEGAEAAARVLQALNALRRARQHYDVVLEAHGHEVPAHRAVLAAAAPALLAAMPAPAAAAAPPPPLRLTDIDPDALAALVDYMYTGSLRVPDLPAARRLYRAAARLRVEPARAHLAERLMRRLTPNDCLQLRALSDLPAPHRAQLDAYIAQNFDEVCASGALAALPLLRIELLRETSSEQCEETPAALAEAALAWIKARLAIYYDVEELCSRVHLLYVDASGALRDCGELPVAEGDTLELEEYRREARERERAGRRRPAGEGGGSGGGDEWAVVACRAGGGATRAVVALRGRLATARVAWRATSASDTPRGGKLGGATDHAPPPAEEGGVRLSAMSVGRCAVGCAAVAGRLVVCGGYDRARALRAVEAFDPSSNTWQALPDMRRARARLCAARLDDKLYVLGGSDGYTELDSVDVYEETDGGAAGRWVSAAPLPVARQYAAAAADEKGGTLLVLGGSAGGRSLRHVHRYTPRDKAWSEAPPLTHGRSQCAAALFGGAVWVLGGCDEWRCLASTELLPLERLDEPSATWSAGPPLPTARRSVGAAVWRGTLVAAGGSAGAASLRLVDVLAAGGAGGWRSGPQLRRPRAAPALTELGGVLYAVGGYSGKEFLSCVERLSDPDGAWTQLVHDPVPATINSGCEKSAEDQRAREKTGVGLPATPALHSTTC